MPSEVDAFDEQSFMRTRFNLTPADVTRSVLPKGQGSLALAQFSTETGPFMIRKTIENKRAPELAFMRGLKDVSDPVRRSLQVRWSLPDVYHVEMRDAETDVYMQAVGGISYRSKAEAAPLARPLVKAIHDLSLLLPVICQIVDLSPPDRGSPGSNFFSQAETLHNGLGEALRTIARFQRHLPRCICHNDIFWPNMGITCTEETPEFTFIDFGMLGWNVVGAELHHFARLSVKSAKDAEFFRRASRHYAQSTRIDARLIEMNALFYAAMRLMAFAKIRRDRLDDEDVKALCLSSLQQFDAFGKGGKG